MLERFPAESVHRKRGKVARAIIARIVVRGEPLLVEAHPLTPAENAPEDGAPVFLLIDLKSQSMRYQNPSH